MTITAVGSTVTGFSHLSNTFTMSTSPTAIGDVVVVGAESYNGVYFQTLAPPTGGGVTTWNLMATDVAPGIGLIVYLYWGIVTSTGPSTLTITMTGNPNYCFANYQQFHSSVSGNWIQDGAGGNNDGTASSGNYPSQSPANPDELYVGGAWLGLGSGTIGGSDAGYAYLNGWGAFNVSTFVYYLGATSPNSYSPAWNQSPSDIFAVVSGLLYALPPVTMRIIGIV